VPARRAASAQRLRARDSGACLQLARRPGAPDAHARARARAEGYLRVYRIRDSGKRLELVHRTPAGGVPGALAPFKGRLLAGVGATLRIYEAGKKKLLRKCEHRKLPTHIASLATLGDRIYVGDLQARPPRPCLPASRVKAQRGSSACMLAAVWAVLRGLRRLRAARRRGGVFSVLSRLGKGCSGTCTSLNTAGSVPPE
jgi:hypothetical protein